MRNILIVDSNTPELNAASDKPTPGETYAAALRASTTEALSVTVVTPYADPKLPPLGPFDGAVFTGSAVEWSTDDPRAKPLADAMRAIFAAGIPTLGSCNGMQLAASVLNGSTDASPNGREDGIAREIHLTDAGRAHPMLAGRQDGYAAPCVHRDEVRRLPEGAVLLAGNGHSPVQAFAYERDGIRFWGMQYHPEFTPAFIGDLIRRIGGMSDAAAGDLQVADIDAEAAQRLGLRSDEMAAPVRLTELRNWLASL